MNLRDIRLAYGYTQQQVADACGCSRSQIAQIERGANLPSVALAKRLGSHMRFQWTKLFEGDQK